MEEETTVGSKSPLRQRLGRISHGLACLVIVSGPSIGERHPLSKERMAIGRSRESEIMIDDASISRRHAEVVLLEGGAALLRDLGSTNGTFLNDQPVVERPLKDGDLIRIGDATLKYIGPNSVEYLFMKEMSERALRDGLTGLFNKQTFHAYLERNLSRCRDLNEPLSVAIMDIDHFKKINDEWGHPVGDFALKAFADLIRYGIRPTDLLARYGGEEFGLILPHTNLMDARSVGERLRNQVAEHTFVFEARRLPVTISVGIAERGEGAEDGERLISCADKALYQAKNEGRNRTCLYGQHG